MEQKKAMPQRHIEDTQLDIFRGQIRLGMDQAAEMLSKFLQPGFNFRISLTDAKDSILAPNPDLQEYSLAGVCLGVEGAISGIILLLFPAEHACRLAGLLLRQDPPADLDGDPLRSTLKEVGNIFASGVLFSFDDRMKLRALPSPPTFLSGSLLQIQEQSQKCCHQSEKILVQARLDCDSPDGVLIEGTAIFEIAAESLEQIVAAGVLPCLDPAVPS